MASLRLVGRGHLNWLQWKAHSVFISSLYSSTRLHLNDLGSLFATFMHLCFISYSWNSESVSSLLILGNSECIASLLILAFSCRKYFMTSKVWSFMELTAKVMLCYSSWCCIRVGETYRKNSPQVNLIRLEGLLKRSEENINSLGTIIWLIFSSECHAQLLPLFWQCVNQLTISFIPLQK